VAGRQVRVTFQPCGRAVFVLPETTILEAAACAGLTIDTPCGGMGTCGKCRIQVISGACEPTEADRQMFGEDELRNGWRLGCQTAVREQAEELAQQTRLVQLSTDGDFQREFAEAMIFPRSQPQGRDAAGVR